MNQEQLQKIDEQIKNAESVLSKLNSKEFKLYFFTLDTKGNPTAGVANIYEHVNVLNKLGYNATILCEKNDYRIRGNAEGNGIAEWLGEEYASLPHISIESGTLNINPNDFVIIPEIFSNIMDQIKGFPCKKIVFSQSYDYLLELLPIGKRWNIDYGFNDVITTSENQAIYISNLFPSINTHVIPVSIPKFFKESDKPKIPVVALSTRNQADAAKIAKSFYLQYPLYKWITFKDMRGLSREQFATELGKCCLAVWVDDVAGFGTFPLEAMQCKTPVIGKMPNLIPEWMESKDDQGNLSIKANGVWTNTTINIPELIATYLKFWLEDSVPTELLSNMEESRDKYTPERQASEIEKVYFGIIENRKAEISSIITNLETAKAQTVN